MTLVRRSGMTLAQVDALNRQIAALGVALVEGGAAAQE